MYGDPCEPGHDGARLRRPVFEDDPDRRIAHVEREAVAEQQDQHDRQDQADGQVAAIPQQLARLLAEERHESTHEWRHAFMPPVPRT